MARKAIIQFNEGSLNSGVVKNLIEITNDAAIGFMLPAGHILWDCGQYPVAIDDEWNDGIFTRDGKAIEPVPTVEDEMNALKAELSATQTALDTVLMGEI